VNARRIAPVGVWELTALKGLANNDFGAGDGHGWPNNNPTRQSGIGKAMGTMPFRRSASMLRKPSFFHSTENLIRALFWSGSALVLSHSCSALVDGRKTA